MGAPSSASRVRSSPSTRKVRSSGVPGGETIENSSLTETTRSSSAAPSSPARRASRAFAVGRDGTRPEKLPDARVDPTRHAKRKGPSAVERQQQLHLVEPGGPAVEAPGDADGRARFHGGALENDPRPRGLLDRSRHGCGAREEGRGERWAEHRGGILPSSARVGPPGEPGCAFLTRRAKTSEGRDLFLAAPEPPVANLSACHADLLRPPAPASRGSAFPLQPGAGPRAPSRARPRRRLRRQGPAGNGGSPPRPARPRGGGGAARHASAGRRVRGIRGGGRTVGAVVLRAGVARPDPGSRALDRAAGARRSRPRSVRHPSGGVGPAVARARSRPRDAGSRFSSRSPRRSTPAAGFRSRTRPGPNHLRRDDPDARRSCGR